MNNFISYYDSFWSLLPPFFAITMSILTRKVVLSLAVSVILGIIMIAGFNQDNVLILLGEALSSVLSLDHVYLILFLLLLGMMTSVINISGGTFAFSLWAASKIKSKQSASLFTVLLGIAIFIDDYFNSLVVGNISKPITDRYKVSRAKLAYLLDSTAAPICVLTPISSWGAYVISVLSDILASKNFNESGLSLFVDMIPLNFYALFAIAMIFIVVFFDFNIGPMRKHELAAQANNIDEIFFPEKESSSLFNLLTPILVLVVSAFSLIFLTGILAINQAGVAVSFAKIMSYSKVNLSLFISGLFGLLAAIFLASKSCGSKDILKEFLAGIKLMLPAVYILVMAWLFADIILRLQTGLFLSTLIQSFSSELAMPPLLFLFSAIIAFATGTSFATFSVMLPIAADMAPVASLEGVSVYMAAVLAGSVCGDHCSPISDTTILSSTGAECSHIVHVETQIPYVVLCSLASLVSYLAIGITGSLIFSFAIGFFSLIFLSFLVKFFQKK